jgi:hypothetical protein
MEACDDGAPVVSDKPNRGLAQYTVWCSDLKGFGVFVLPSSTRTYFVDYRNANNVRRRMKLGRHGLLPVWWTPR